MSEVTDIVVPMLQRIQSEIGLLRGDVDNLKDDMRHVKVRLTSVEENLVSMNRRISDATGALSLRPVPSNTLIIFGSMSSR